MKKYLIRSFSCLFLLSLPVKINSQTQVPKIYMPPEFRKAYENGTRTYEGLPGKNLWHNTCHYTIEAKMNPQTRELTGREWIEYTNNSPDTLKHLGFQLYQDVYKKGGLRSFPAPEETGGVILGRIVVDGDTIKENDLSDSYTIMFIKLNNRLKPGSSLKIEVNWKVQIIGTSYIREGYADSTSAFVGLWYPKLAVYDDIFGWNVQVYNFKEEFYSPLSTYDVTLNLPEGFCVWATGKLENQDNYPPILNDRLTHAYATQGTVQVIDSTTILDKNQIGRYPWRFHADSVPDFAFAFSDHYLWDAAVLNVGTRKVLISTAYPKNQYRNYRHITRAVTGAMEVYSLKDPGVPFPYSNFTSFYGLNGGGMEYPMMTYDCSFRDTLLDSYVTIHEMLHTYAPFYLRTNETNFAWMDEGLTDFYTVKMLAKLNYSLDTLVAWNKRYLERGILGFGNLPLFTSSTCWNTDNMAGLMYVKPAQMLTALEDMIGSETWKKCFNAFVQTWKYKAPMPYDFFFFVDNYLKKDLSWFWDKWFMHFGYPDLAIQKVDRNKVIIENRGLLPIPFTVHFTDESGKEKDMVFHANAWKGSNSMFIEVSRFRFSKIEVKCNLVADYELKDNIWERY
jgi:hypothetical protein